MMPCGDLYPSMNYGMPHQQLKMLVPVMLLGAGCKSPARELQGASSQFTKIRLFSQHLVRAYISFDKASEQTHSVLYDFGHRHRRKVARLFQRSLGFTDIAPKILRIQIFNLAPIDDIHIRILPTRLLNEVCQGNKFRSSCDILQSGRWRRQIKVELLANVIDQSPLS